MDVGTNVWFKTQDAVVWAAGEVVDCKEIDGVVQVRRLDTDDVVTCRYPDELCLRNMSTNFLTMSSLTSLEHLHEASLLQALNERFNHDEIYTSIGDILVALNPLKPLPHLYSNTQLETYKQALTSSSLSPSTEEKGLPPHVFAIGGKAFGGLLKPERRNQSILVSGESGSGKTESTKFLMQFLTSVGQDSAVNTTDALEIGRRILQTNPILESFGNARTIRNDNSSRFGKFIKIQFGDQNEIVGAQIECYLLEKVRVLHQNPDERSFHIFYELLEGAEPELLDQLALQKGGTYQLLNAYGPTFSRQRAIADKYAQLYVETVRALDDMGVHATERVAIFQILAALLHLGNVDFSLQSGQTDEVLEVTSTSRFHLEKCAHLLGLDVVALETLLSCRKITAGLESMVLQHSPGQAKESARALAKALYGRLFTWLVRRLSNEINALDAAVSISDEADEVATIGILDIFGFESLTRNGFEQLCINYANERLQAQFNDFVFVREQELYQREQLDWTHISYPRNTACLALFEDKSNGLFSLLDQECLMPKGSNPALCTKFYRYHGDKNAIETFSPLAFVRRKGLHRALLDDEKVTTSSKSPFAASKLERVNHQFVVHHFAGHVCYQVEQFVEKNTDALPADVSSLLAASTNTIVQEIEAEDTSVASETAPNESIGRPRRYSMLRAPSVSAQFKSQLDRLIVQIGRTEAHYVRCLKPNEIKTPGIFDRPRMVEQMQSVGILEAVRIARHGYAVRLAHRTFLDQFAEFQGLVNVQMQSNQTHDRVQALGSVLLDRFLEYCGETTQANDVLRRKYMQVGKTLVFFKAKTYAWLTRYRFDVRTHRTIILQRSFRGYLARQRYQKLREKVVQMQALGRGFLGRQRAGRLRTWRREIAATRLERWWKRIAMQRHVQLQRQIAAVVKIQSLCRRRLALQQLVVAEEREHAAATVIQRQSRRWRTRTRCCQSTTYLAPQGADEIEAELSPRDDKSMARSKSSKRGKESSLELQEDTLSSEEHRVESPLGILTPSVRRVKSRRRQCHQQPRHTDVDARNSMLENEILRLQQLLVDQQSGDSKRWKRALRPQTSVPVPSRHTKQRLNLSSEEEEDDEEEENTSDEVPVPSDPVSLLTHKIQELDAKCQFLEQLVVQQTTHHDETRRVALPSKPTHHHPSYDMRRMTPIDTEPQPPASNVDAILANIQTQMHLLRQSVAEKEEEEATHCHSSSSSSARRSHVSSPARPLRSSSTASTIYSHVPSLPLSSSQLSTGGSTSTSPVHSFSSSSSFYFAPNAPPRSAPAHFGGRNMPRIVKWARSTNCYECNEPFNLFVRRHHCRMCGNSFCHEHSSRRVSVYGIGFDHEPVRVCDPCFAEYYATSHDSLTPPQFSPIDSMFRSPQLSTSSRRSGL